MEQLNRKPCVSRGRAYGDEGEICRIKHYLGMDLLKCYGGDGEFSSCMNFFCFNLFH